MRRTLLVLSILAVFLCIPLTAQAATVNVAPGGNLDAAYAQATASQPALIQLQSGNYGQWHTPTGSAAVTIKGVTGTKFTQVDVNAANTTWDGVAIDAGGAAVSPLYVSGQLNTTFKNGSVGNATNKPLIYLAGRDLANPPMNPVIDNVRIWGAIVNFSQDPDPHSECIYSQASGIVVRNSRFEGVCGTTGGIFLTRGTWWNPQQEQYGGFTFIGNTFGRMYADHSAIIFSAACEPPNGGPAVCDRVTIKNNTFDPASVVSTTWSSGTFTNSVESCNSQPVNEPGIVHEPCGTPPPACSDGLDNDGDTKVDYPADPGCTSTTDTTESPDPPPPPPPPAACNDGNDNDGDGKTDFPADPGCTSTTDTTESPDPPPPPPPAPQCSDGIDNDADGKVDFPADLGCTSTSDTTESPNPPPPPPAPQCSDGSDNDADSLVDFPADPGCTSATDTTESPNPPPPPPPPKPACSDGIDNDRDGRIDYPNDSGCSSATDTTEKGKRRASKLSLLWYFKTNCRYLSFCHSSRY